MIRWWKTMTTFLKIMIIDMKRLWNHSMLWMMVKRMNLLNQLLVNKMMMLMEIEYRCLNLSHEWIQLILLDLRSRMTRRTTLSKLRFNPTTLKFHLLLIFKKLSKKKKMKNSNMLWRKSKSVMNLLTIIFCFLERFMMLTRRERIES